MISELEIKGWKTLRDVRIPLQAGITVFVGANNSGKSNALAALRFLGQLAQRGSFTELIQVGGGFERFVSRGGEAMSLAVSRRGEDEECRYQLDTRQGRPFLLTAEELRFTRPDREPVSWTSKGGEILGPQALSERTSGSGGDLLRVWVLAGHNGQLTASPDSFAAGKALLEELTRLRVVDLSPASLRREAVPQRGIALEADGLNLPAVLDVLSSTQPRLFAAIEQALRPPVTDIEHLRTPLGVQPGAKVVGIQEADGQVYRADEISDGLLLFIGMTVAAQQAGELPSLIAIEEPERGIHPRRLRDLVDQFRRLAAGGTQVVLTTHSPILLDEFRDEPESVLIFERDAQHGTRVQRLADHPEWSDELARSGSLGDLWYSGVLGGVPR